MYSNPRRQPFTVQLDSSLVQRVEKMTDDRDQAIEEALRLWCQQQAEAKLRRSTDFHRQRHDNDEVGWLV